MFDNETLGYAEFRIGDRVKFEDNYGMKGTGVIVDINGSTCQVEFAHGATWHVPLRDLILLEPEPDTHTCAPYVGVFRVESKCVHCSRFMLDSEVTAYVKKIGE
jgi:hypothetical protein